MEREDFMKLGGAIFLALGLALTTSMRPVGADTGHEGAVRKEVGSYVETRQIPLSNSAATEIAVASTKRPNEICFNNSAFTIWVGSNAASTSLVQVGFPILSSSTFRVGAFTGNVYALLDTGGVGNVRCWDGLVR